MLAGFGTGRMLIAVFALAALTACAPIVESHGYVPTDADLAEIEPGVDTMDTVEVIAGRPASTSFLDQDGWFYVKSEYRQVGPAARRETARDIVAIFFDEDEVVQAVERLGIEDGEIVALSRRVTDAPTAGIGFFQQLFGNIGNFNPGQFLSE